ncbi:hypothetical protein MtrunA17_Chr3g0098631 [Medicago truncatula]|uniref:Transmembrane protein n=1 Tax=Medicago truncatula TaxID=3880 RepID=A0A396IRE8_MEDTR|nr:hypothetical protein MtrunA17_Chr3g0098631 [Medicago truncatula]
MAVAKTSPKLFLQIALKPHVFSFDRFAFIFTLIVLLLGGS